MGCVCLARSGNTSLQSTHATIIKKRMRTRCCGASTGFGRLAVRELQTMHLFAGHGGGLLCDLILGHKPIVAVEWDRYACRVLRERAKDGWFPGLHVWEGDVRLFDPSEYAGVVDCIHAGFPCTDVSTAGAQAGVGPETRSGLYREVLRIASVVRPRYIYLENVAAIVHNGLGTVLGDLAALGYVGQWTCLRASDCGASHERDRWWGLFSNTDEPQCERRGLSSGAHQEHADVGGGAWGENKSTVYGMDDELAYRLDENRGLIKDQHRESRAKKESSQESAAFDTARRLSDVRKGCDRSSSSQSQPCFGSDSVMPSMPHKCGHGNSKKCWDSGCFEKMGKSQLPSEMHLLSERVYKNEVSANGLQQIVWKSGGQAAKSWWDVVPNVLKVDDPPNRTHRLKGIGNGQVPLQAAFAWKILGGP